MNEWKRREPTPDRQPECVLVLPVYDGADEPSWAASLGYMDYTTGILTPMGERWSFDTLDQALDATYFLAQYLTDTRGTASTSTRSAVTAASASQAVRSFERRR